MNRLRLDAILWIAQLALALVCAVSGIAKALLPEGELQGHLGLLLDVHPGILRPVGVVELVLAFGLILPAGAKVLPRLTPFAALCLAATLALGTLQPASGGGVGQLAPNLLLAAAAAFVAWGRAIAVPIESEGFGPEPTGLDPATAARLERNRQRHAARLQGARRVA